MAKTSNGEKDLEVARENPVTVLFFSTLQRSNVKDECMGLTNSAEMERSGVMAAGTDAKVVTNFLFYTQQRYLSKGEDKN